MTNLQSARQSNGRSGKWQIPATILNIMWGDIAPRLLANVWRRQDLGEGEAWFPNANYSYAARNWLDVAQEDSDFDPGIRQAAKDTLERFSDVYHAGEDLIHLFDLEPGTASGAHYDARYQEDIRTRLVQEIERLKRLNQTRALPAAHARFEKRASRVQAYLKAKGSVPIQIHDEVGYDFVLSTDGISFFTPPRPVDPADLMHTYTIRDSGRRPIGIPTVLQSNVDVSPFGPVEIVRLEIPTQVGMIVRRRERQKNGEPIEVFRARQRVRLEREENGWWEMTGAAYLAVMHELPRFIAEVWRNRFDGGPTTLEEAYTDDEDLREEFQNRLELSLPSVADMRHFNAASANNGARPYAVDPDTDSADGLWIAGDVNIVDRGIFFPQLPSAEDPPNLDALLLDIAGGGSGNPVFTGTHRGDGP